MKKAINKMMQKVQVSSQNSMQRTFKDLKKLALSTLCLNQEICAVVWDNAIIEADDKQKIRVFIPEWAKTFIPSCKDIYADGTYKKCHQPFTQLFVMSGEGEDGVN